MFSIDGIVSGFDTTGIIESLLGFQDQQIETFNTRKADITTEQTAFKGIEARLLSLQTSLSRLNRTSSSVFDAISATSSNEDILQVAADSGANEGVYQLTVDSIASAHQIASQGFSETSEQIASGTVTIQVGDGAPTTITVDEGNNTLESFVASINDQVSDVNAGLVFDQGSDSYRILLTSKNAGSDNEITLTSTSSGGAGTVLDFSGPAVQEATDTVVTLGSGPGAISASYGSTKIDGLISGVTLDVKSADPGSAVTIELQRDTSIAQEAIEAFVAEYNGVIDTIDASTRYDPATDQASPLLGNRSVSVIKNELLSAVTSTVAVGGGVNRLSQIGIDVNIAGKLTIDSVKLGEALDGSLEGVEPDDIKNLFGLNATTSNAGIEFLNGSTRSVASDVPYEIDITQAAEQATITASSALGGSLVIDDNNNQLQITLDGIVTESLTLANGTYTAEELASHVQSTINQSEELGVHQAIVSLSDTGELVITSEAYGSESSLSSVSGTAASLLGFSGTESDFGQDVAGVFLVDGVEEIAKGTGRLLVGDSENANTADLQFIVSLTSDQVVAGADSNLQVSRGVTGQLDKFVANLTDGERGLLSTVEDEFETRLESIDQSIERVQQITDSRREALLAEFAALESILNELQNTGSFISSQLTTLKTNDN